MHFFFLNYHLTVAGLLLWCNLSDERSDFKLELLLALVRAVFLGLDFRGTYDKFYFIKLVTSLIWKAMVLY
jgi:hypothetical protein